MSRLIKLRILGYVATIVMHVSNILYMGWFKKSNPTDNEQVKQFKSLEYRFFTTWTFILQIAYAIYALTCDLFVLKNSKKKNYELPSPISDFREILFAGLVWPSSMVVFTVFWGLYSYDRALIFPEFLDAVIPPISNHVIHTMIVPVVLWEVVMRPRKEPENHARNHVEFGRGGGHTIAVTGTPRSVQIISFLGDVRVTAIVCPPVRNLPVKKDGEPFLGAVDKLGTAYEDAAIATGLGAYMATPLIREAVSKGTLDEEGANTMSHHIYFRILGYVVTITMHVSNMLVMMSSFHGEPMKNDYVRHFSDMQFFFFTCWTFVFQTIYAIFGLYTDILTLKNSKSAGYEVPKFLVDSRDALFSILIWPSTVLVFTVFWSFWSYDRNLLFPEDIDLVITSTSNHIMHTYIFPVTLWEVMFRSRKPPRNHRWHVLGVLMAAIVYFRVLFMVHAIRGVWVYPIFGVMSGSIIFYFFFLFVLAYLPVIYYAQWALNSVVHSSREKNQKVC